MLTKRIVPVMFESAKNAEKIVSLASFYNKSGADEVFINIEAESTSTFYSIFKSVGKELFIPLTASGNIDNIDDFENCLNSGADKVNIKNTVSINESLVSEAATKYGDQAVVVFLEIDFIKDEFVLVSDTNNIKGIDNINLYLKKLDTLGVGEIVIHSVRAEKTKAGFDTQLIESLINTAQMPLIVSGGAASPKHFLDIYNRFPQISGFAANELFHSETLLISELKEYLFKNGVPTRI